MAPSRELAKPTSSITRPTKLLAPPTSSRAPPTCPLARDIPPSLSLPLLETTPTPGSPGDRDGGCIGTELIPVRGGGGDEGGKGGGEGEEGEGEVGGWKVQPWVHPARDGVSPR